VGVLEATDVVVSFGGNRALDSASVVAPEGQITGLIGPNGAGKTTLFTLISGFQTPTAGRVRFLGDDITGQAPEALAVPGTDLHHPAFYENANDVYPDRELNAYEINHVISTHFNDVRLKNFIEFRHWDSLPVARAERLTEIIGSLFYDPTNLDRLESYFDGIREEDVFEAKANLQARGSQAIPYGNSLEFWQEFLGLEGVLADEPGDPKHPDVFQA